MNIQTISVSAPARLCLGRQGENAVTGLAFDVSAWEAAFGAGSVALLVRRRVDADPYPVALTQQGTAWLWTVSAADTAFAGYGEAQLIYTVDGAVKKTAIYQTQVLPSLSASTVDPPDPIETYVEQILAAAAEAAASASDAGASAVSAENSAGAAYDSALDAASEADRAERAAEAARVAITFTDAGSGEIIITKESGNDG